MKRAFPTSRVREFLESGPIVLVSSRWRDETNIMTMGWHTVMEFTPALVGCIIAGGNRSFEMIRKSRECVINLPTTALADTVVRIGNSTGAEIDKFAAFGLTAEASAKVAAPRIREAHAHFECKLHDASLIGKYNFFIFEVVHALAETTPKNPETLHYKGRGEFMLAGKTISRRRLFRPEILQPE